MWFYTPQDFSILPGKMSNRHDFAAKTGSPGFLLVELALALGLLTIFLFAAGRLINHSYHLFRDLTVRTDSLNRAIGLLESGKGGEVRVLRSDCRYRRIFVHRGLCLFSKP